MLENLWNADLYRTFWACGGAYEGFLDFEAGITCMVMGNLEFWNRQFSLLSHLDEFSVDPEALQRDRGFRPPKYQKQQNDEWGSLNQPCSLVVALNATEFKFLAKTDHIRQFPVCQARLPSKLSILWKHTGRHCLVCQRHLKAVSCICCTVLLCFIFFPSFKPWGCSPLSTFWFERKTSSGRQLPFFPKVCNPTEHWFRRTFEGRFQSWSRMASCVSRHQRS